MQESGRLEQALSGGAGAVTG